MKHASTKKNNIVIMLDEFNNVWTDKTIPSTELQCIRYVCFKNWTHAMQKGIVKIVTIDQFAQMPKAAAA
jgi:S-adenosylmethionine hydrolase